MTKEVRDHIYKTFEEGVDFKPMEGCDTCMTIYNEKILEDPIVKEYLRRTSKNNE